MADTPDASPNAAQSGTHGTENTHDASSGDTPGASGAGARSQAAPTESTGRRAGGAAILVAAGIFLSRIMGLVRERAISHFFGIGPHADVFRVALKTPNFLQNLLGEGTISAAFIPVYSRFLAEDRPETAGRFAGAVFGLLVVTVTVLVGLGVLFARPLLSVLLAGWAGDAGVVTASGITVNRFELAVATVKITFPMAGLLVLFAWGLGVMNSHRRFFLPYVAPVAWNAAIIAALVIVGFAVVPDPLTDAVPASGLDRLLFAGLLGALGGGALQFAVLLPGLWREMKGFRPALSTRVEGVREALRAFVPVVLGRGAYQLSGYVDTFLAAFLAAGAIAAQSTALQLYILPISLFGMSVAASELPVLSRISTDRLHSFLDRVRASLRQILYMVVPTMVGYLLFGRLIVGAFFQTGRFGTADSWLVFLVLGAYSLGLLATTATRLLQNAFYALSDTKTPAVIAGGRLVISGAAGAGLMLLLDRVALTTVPGVPALIEAEALRLGAVGLALGASLGAWVELALLVRALRRHDPQFLPPFGRAAQMIGLALLAALPALGMMLILPERSPHLILRAALVVGTFGVTYLGLGHALGFSEGETWTGRLLTRIRR